MLYINPLVEILGTQAVRLGSICTCCTLFNIENSKKKEKHYTAELIYVKPIDFDLSPNCPNGLLKSNKFLHLFFPPRLTLFRAYKADCDNNMKLGTLRSGMSWLTLSRTIPTAIFTILASYALWESHAPYKNRQRLRQTVAFIFFV